MYSYRRLLNLLESAQTTLGEALEIIVTESSTLEREGREVAELMLRLGKIADRIATCEKRRESA